MLPIGPVCRVGDELPLSDLCDILPGGRAEAELNPHYVIAGSEKHRKYTCKGLPCSRNTDMKGDQPNVGTLGEYAGGLAPSTDRVKGKVASPLDFEVLPK